MEATAVRQRERPRALDLEAPEGTILVRRTVYGAETETRETVRVPVFHTAPAKVRVGGSVTRNLGDYNSARVEVMVELPCNPVHDEIEQTYLYASGLVDTYIARELNLATNPNANT